MRVVGSMIVFLCAASAHATPDPSALAAKRSALVKTLGTPARPEAVDAEVAKALRDAADVALVTVQALDAAKGPYAVRGLVRLTRHAQRTVREQAWRAIARQRYRSDALATLVERRLQTGLQGDILGCIARALGQAGDARHVPTLLALATQESAVTRRSAFGALRALTGVRLPDELGQWEAWWRLRKKRGNIDLRAALGALETDRTKHRTLQLRIVLRDAWFELPHVVETLRVWLRIHNARLRVQAAQLIADLRLIDLVADLQSLHRFADVDEERRAAQEALARLDVPIQ